VSRGWQIKTTEFPYSYEAEKRGFRISSPDGKKFTVFAPDGEVLVADMGTSLEAHRVAEAAINRTNTINREPVDERLARQAKSE
jgi:hypothetical protein